MLLRLALVGLSLVASALVLEGLAGLQLRKRFVRGAELGNTWRTFGQRDASLGWSGRPNVQGRVTDGRIDYRVAHNRAGFRDPERSLSKRPGLRRVLVLGDSVTWGWGVQAGERFSDLLEARLGPDVEVLNMGCPGYGTDQQYWTLVEKGLAYEPDVVLLCFVVNDIPEANATMRYGMPKPRIQRTSSGDWVEVGRPVELPGSALERWGKNIWRRWTVHSALLTLVTGRALDPPAALPAKVGKKRSGKPSKEALQPLIDVADSIVDPESVTFHLLTQLRDVCRERGLPLLVTHVAHKHDQYLYDPTYPMPTGPHESPFQTYLSRSLAAICASLGLPFVCTDDAFLKACRNGMSLHVGDGHPNAHGHRVIADCLEAPLRASLTP